MILSPTEANCCLFPHLLALHLHRSERIPPHMIEGQESVRHQPYHAVLAGPPQLEGVGHVLHHALPQDRAVRPYYQRYQSYLLVISIHYLDTVTS